MRTSAYLLDDTATPAGLLALRLLALPLALPKAAASMSNRQAAIYGGFGFFLCTFCVGRGFATIGEPFGDLPTCFRDMSLFGGAFAAFFTTVAAVVVAGLHCDMVGHEKRAAIVRAACLAPVSFFLPVAVWSFCASFRSPAMNIASGKPGWMESPAAQVLGSDVWLLVFPTCFALLLAWTACRLKKLCAGKPPRCRGCDYLLVGLEGSRCPECGRFFSFHSASEREALRAPTRSARRLKSSACADRADVPAKLADPAAAAAKPTTAPTTQPAAGSSE